MTEQDSDAVQQATDEAFDRWGSTGIHALVDALEQNAASRVKAALALRRFTRPLIGIAEAAGVLSLSSLTVRAMARDGSLPSVRVGKSLRFSVSDLLAWVSARPAAA